MSVHSSPHSERLVVIGGSAGGVEALSEVVAGLPADLPAAVCVVVHMSQESPGMLPGILSRSGSLPASPATDGAPLRPGEIIVAPPGRHLVVEDGVARLSVEARENGHRPAIDVLFRSAARARGGLAVGVILSGVLDDGTAGLAAIKAAGGAAVAQDPADAAFGQMPASAIAAVDVDAVLPASRIPRLLMELIDGTTQPRRSEMQSTARRPDDDHAVASVCPECGGLLREDPDAPVLQWRCNVGHRYSAATLADAQGQDVEDNIWAVIRSLEDRSKLLARMADQQQGPGREGAARHLRQRAAEAADHARAVWELQRRVLGTTLQPLSREARQTPRTPEDDPSAT